MLEKGIISVACGHPYYGRMAYCLCLTIKNADPSTHFTVIQSPGSLAHLSESQLAVFDNIIDIPEGSPIGCGAKLWANLVTPYERTLLLDADMLWLPERKPGQLFNELADVDFTAITEGFAPGEMHPKYFLWADESDIRNTWPIKSERLYQWRSEVMYFNKNADELFAKAREVFLNPRLKTEQLYAGGTADELGLGIAAGILDAHPHLYKWQPAYWHLMNEGKIPEFSWLYANYYLASFGANYASGNSKKLYDMLVKSSCYNRGVQHVFPLISKKEFIPERIKM